MLHRPSSSHPPVRRQRGFTLIELLVVIGIIVLLMAILLPVAGRVRIQAQSAHTDASMTAIAAAIERYYQDNHAYPGLFSNGQMCGGAFGTMPPVTITPAVTGAGAVVTGSENMAMALMGGFEGTFDANGNLTGINVNVDTGTIGKGPLNLSPAVVYRTRKTPYLDAGASYLPSQPYSGSGCVSANPDLIGVVGGMDTGIPEFLDNYSSSRRPIIYLRANVGVDITAKPLCTVMATKDPTAAQYNTFEFSFYKRGAAPTTTDFPGDFTWNTTTGDFEFYASEADYLRSPNAPFNSGTKVGTPRGKDKFILMSAGPDHCFGTKDDRFYGGN